MQCLEVMSTSFCLLNSSPEFFKYPCSIDKSKLGFVTFSEENCVRKPRLLVFLFGVGYSCK